MFHIEAADLFFANGDGIPIASGSFGTLDGLRLLPHTHALWDFTFNLDAVQFPDRDLSTLRCCYSTYNHD